MSNRSACWVGTREPTKPMPWLAIASMLALELLPLPKTTLTEAGSTPTASSRVIRMGSETDNNLVSGRLPATV